MCVIIKKNLLSGLDVDWILNLPEHLFKLVGLLTEKPLRQCPLGLLLLFALRPRWSQWTLWIGYGCLTWWQRRLLVTVLLYAPIGILADRAKLPSMLGAFSHTQFAYFGLGGLTLNVLVFGLHLGDIFVHGLAREDVVGELAPANAILFVLH